MNVRRWTVLSGTAAAVAVHLLSAVPASAQPAPATTVSVAPGPPVEQWMVRPCNDAVGTYQLPLSFVLQRTGPAAEPMTAWYKVSGTAVPGVHYEPLSGTAVFAAGAAEAIVPVVPRAGASPALVDLTLQLQSVTGVVSFGATSATISFVSPWDQRPVECGYGFTADAWNRTQTVAAGQPLHALTLEQVVPPGVLPASGVFRVVSGFLPRNIQLQPDGTFSGRAAFPGTSTGVIEACRSGPPGTCVRTQLTVNVVVPAVAQLPACPWPGFSSLPVAVRSYLKQMMPSLAFCS